MTSATYRVTGMTCEHCARAVPGELKSLDGVRDVTVALVPGDASAVTVTSDGPLARQAVADASARPATTGSPGAKQAARRPSRAARVKSLAGRDIRSVRPEGLYPERAGLHVTA